MKPRASENPTVVTDHASPETTWYDHLRLAAYFPNDPDTLEAD
jgi:hypothetical protein